MKAPEKTNVMRILDKAGIPYQIHTYEGVTSGTDVAALLNQDPERVFKTLVTVGKSGSHYVFVVPVNGALNLKKAAAAAGEKSIAMIKSKELLPLTGYIHGGCSPIGMKKAFPTFFHVSAESLPTLMFSAGKVGFQVEADPAEIRKLVGFAYADLI